jgi:hypothetical protein
MSAAADRRYMGRVAALGCAICRRLGYGWKPACVHHRITHRGMGRRAPDTETAPLCHDHHQGAAGIHTLGRLPWEKKFGVTELELIAETQRALGYTGPGRASKIVPRPEVFQR